MKQVRAILHWRFWLCCWTAACCMVAHGQPLEDPTRPPPDRLPATLIPGSSETAGNSQVLSRNGLKLVLSGAHRRVAVLDGQLLHSGNELAGTRLVTAAAHLAVLERDGQKEQLSLHPQVEKITRRPTSPSSQTDPKLPAHPGAHPNPLRISAPP